MNDNWGTASNATQISQSGLAPLNSAESAIMLTLNPGAYTAVLRGVGPSPTGNGLIAVFQVKE